MKAVLFRRYGSADALALEEIERPTPGDGEVLLRVRAVSLNDWDVGALAGADLVNRVIFGLLHPTRRILGSDVPGTIEALGPGVRALRVGDDVYGDLSGAWGGFAEFVCARETALVAKPPGMTFEQAAATPQAALLALQALRDVAHLAAGQTLLINGAGGGVGTFAMQIARWVGAEVTAVDSAPKLAMLRAMGAAHVIDYAREDFARGTRRYDVILDVKSTRSLRACARALNRAGVYVTVGGSMARLAQGLAWWPWIAATSDKRVRILALKPNAGLALMNELFASGAVVPVIGGSYTLDTAADAFRYLASGRHEGKLVVTVA